MRCCPEGPIQTLVNWNGRVTFPDVPPAISQVRADRQRMAFRAAIRDAVGPWPVFAQGIRVACCELLAPERLLPVLMVAALIAAPGGVGELVRDPRALVGWRCRRFVGSDVVTLRVAVQAALRECFWRHAGEIDLSPLIVRMCQTLEQAGLPTEELADDYRLVLWSLDNV